jgi:hypothetical protein
MRGNATELADHNGNGDGIATISENVLAAKTSDASLRGNGFVYMGLVSVVVAFYSVTRLGGSFIPRLA